MDFSWAKGSLKTKVIQGFAFLGIVFSLEVALVIFSWLKIDHHYYQLELAQESRLLAQQTTMDLKSFLEGEKNNLTPLMATAREENLLLSTLATGGDWKGKTVDPPSTLQALSLTKTRNAWDEYFSSVTLLATNEIWKDSTIRINAGVLNDSIAPPAATFRMMDPKVAQARAFVDGQWVRVSSLLHEFENDVRFELKSQIQNLNLLVVAIVVADVLLLSLYFILFQKLVINRLQRLKSNITDRHLWTEVGNDEINAIGNELNSVIKQFEQASDFVLKIGEGKLDERFGNEDERSKLAEALEGMQTKLKSINEEDQKRRWANEGLTRFVDILRSGNDNIRALGDRIIATLVQYTQSNQGGLYVVEDEGGQKMIELVSLFAFNTKKFEQHRLKPGEGLVGQSYLEKETIFLTEIPEDYIRITSGLGGANPKSILIVPLKIDKEIYGIVELASFHEYQPHEIAFVEKLGETIASTLSSVKSNERTRKLLEDFQQQTEQMRAQEEEMRQNMEELTATQEEMTRKEKDYILKIKQLEERPVETVPGDDWAIATEMEKTLRVQLDVLAIQQKEISDRD